MRHQAHPLVARATNLYSACVGVHDNTCELPVEVSVDGELRLSYTTLVRTCGYGVVLDTKVVGPFRVHLSSDYLGDLEGRTQSSHFFDAPDRVPVYAGWCSAEHTRAQIDVRWAPRSCLYDHLQRLLDLFERLGHVAAIEVSGDALAPFEALAAGRSVAAGCAVVLRARSSPSVRIRMSCGAPISRASSC